MRVLVVGSGGREHALCRALAASPGCQALFAAPGNAGIAEIARCHPVRATDLDGILALCLAERIDFVVVGPEAPLVLGLVDRLEQAGILAFGPNRAAAEIEGSKGFMKDLASASGIPTAAYRRVRDAAEAKALIRLWGAPIVVKADGLAAGKGVVVARTVGEAEDAVDALMAERRFGAAGDTLVIEELLAGEELSYFVLTDGTRTVALGSAQDHKAAYDGDTGPNTGGMGAYSPAPCLTPALEAEIMMRIVEPALAGMRARGRPFKGVLFAGLMLTSAGPKLIEFNARFGDPECEVLIRRLRTDLLPLLVAAAAGDLAGVALDWDPRTALGVVMAARGYPDAPVTGTAIGTLQPAVAAAPEIEIFHAATEMCNGELTSTGGRVLVVTALGDGVAEARVRAYRAVDRVDWPGGFCRRDIGWRALPA